MAMTRSEGSLCPPPMYIVAAGLSVFGLRGCLLGVDGIRAQAAAAGAAKKKELSTIRSAATPYPVDVEGILYSRVQYN